MSIGPFVRYPGSDQIQWEYDDATGHYHEFAEDGTVTLDRPYTADEQGEANDRATVAAQDTNATQVQAKALQALADLQALIDTAPATINAGPAPYVKAIARALRLVIRLQLRRFDGAS